MICQLIIDIIKMLLQFLFHKTSMTAFMHIKLNKIIYNT